jgi:predicted ATPase/class 3 adenylate cyclase
LNVQADAPFAAPSGVVTFLFTDVEGSTRRWEADAQSMRAALAAHDDVLHKAVDGHGGLLFKHTGDGVCAAFSSPRAAVDAAVAAQRILELPVRMGIATGEAELRGGDYFGAVLNRVARLMAAGHGGQLLVDGVTAGLLSGVELMSMGDRRLRDIVKPVAIHQVRAPGLAVDFPPLRTVDPTPGNLRPSSTSFVGREIELAEVETALKAHRLVTLIGVGGVGKTRLALEAAAKVADGFPDGVWVIDLASVGDPTALPEAVAAVLGITQQPGLSVAESVAAALAERSRLLVFDNCEHVLDAAADMIAAILVRSTTVYVLATSREGLRVADEQLWPVSPLGLDSGAATLFVARASGVAPGVALSETDLAIAEICARLDGIPLAIELAASRMQSMTVAEVRDRLDDRFRLLVGSRRGVERHQTLRHAVQWSYDLLKDDERSLLQRCSVFAGGFGLAATVAVGGGDEYSTLDLLDNLVRKSLLVADRSSGRTRFSMLETIRQFAEERLASDRGADAARAAHAGYYAGREADVLALWDSPRQHEAYTWLAVELANLRAAFRWAAGNHDVDTAAAIASYTAFIGFWVDQYEAVSWAEELIAPAKAVAHRRLGQLYLMAAQCYTTGRIDDATAYGDAGRLVLASGNVDAIPYDLETAFQGAVYVTTGHPERWVDLSRTIIARRPGPHTYTRSALVFALTFTGSTNEALNESAGLAAAADTTSNPDVACFALFAYGWARTDVEPEAAYDALRRALMMARDSGNRQIASHIAVNLTRLATNRDDADAALDYVTLAVRSYYDCGNFSLLPTGLAVLTALLDRLARAEPAATMSRFATTTFTQLAYPELAAAIRHLREVLGADGYESLAQAGAVMTPAAMATYAIDQIDEARAELE